MGVAIAAAIRAVAAFGLSPLMARIDQIIDAEQRFEASPPVVADAQQYLLIRSGMGSLVPAFQAIEPLERLEGVYWKHAPNDYLEIWLETG